jgi:hypothetical protein
LLQFQVSACVTDTAANMTAAGKELTAQFGVPWHGCLAHLLELVSGIVFKAPFLKTTLNAARKAVSRYTMSPQQWEALQK